MNKAKQDIKTYASKNQLFLFGYERYFNLFIKMFEKKNLPNTILLSGLKGSGKSTFIYHFVNYLLSKNEDKKYLLNNYSINENNSSYKLVNSNIHPNLFSVENDTLENNIKIEQIRNLLQFLNKSTYRKDLKIVIIDNSEYLNLNSSNALLKAIEEPKDNTFFFIIHDNSHKLLDTIKSRCVEFKIFQKFSEKKIIFNNIASQYLKEPNIDNILENLYYDSPGNLLRYLLLLNNQNLSMTDDLLKCISHFIEKYKNEKSFEILNYINLFIDKFYRDLCMGNSNINGFLINQSKIHKLIDEMKRYNLNEKNVFIWINEILLNETK